MMFADTVADELRRTAVRHPEVAAFHFHGRDRTYAEWDAAADRFARALLAAGLGAGDRIVLLLPPIPEYLFLYLGAARVGVITAGISTRYRRQEIGEILANADPRLVVTVDRDAEVDFPALLDAARRQAPSLERIVRFDGNGADSLAALLAAGDRADVDLAAAAAAVGPRDPIAIVYTSGTTGTPKGAVYDSAAMIALTRLFSTRLPAPPPPGECNLWPGMSLTHVGAMVRLHIQIAFAGTLVLHDRFDARWCVEQLQRLRPARLGGFPPVLMLITRDPEFAGRDWSFVKAVTFGGAPLARHLVDEITAKLGVEVFTGYSCTETAIISATLASDPPERREGTVGRPTAGIAVHIVDAQRQPLPAGAPGHIAVHSPATMRGYWRRPRETAEALDDAGWLYTEDMGFLDEHGYLHLIGRDKDMYYRAAFNVYPGEVEQVLQSHPKVAQAAVVGIPDDILGHKGWAFVVPADPADPPSLAELRAHVGAEMASYKRPDGLTVLAALPTNAMYKVDKRVLRESWTG
ncbi:MAG: class I adenylate-forming enzyme family protein [Candidatus Binatia bacterium]